MYDNYINKKSLNGKLWEDIYLNRLWTLCILKASKQNNCPIKLSEGQFITSKQELSKEFGRSRSPQSVWNYLKELEHLKLLKIDITRKYTTITINNFKDHVFEKEEIIVAMTNKPDRTSYILAYLLCEQILKWKQNFKLPTRSQFHKWAIIIDRIIRIDGKTHDLVEKVILFATNDEEDAAKQTDWPGWRYQILSANALRKHFEKLEISMCRKEKKNIGRISDTRVRKYRIPGMKFGGTHGQERT